MLQDYCIVEYETVVYKIDCLLMPKKKQTKKKPTGLMSKNRGLVLRVATVLLFHVGADESGQDIWIILQR